MILTKIKDTNEYLLNMFNYMKICRLREVNKDFSNYINSSQNFRYFDEMYNYFDSEANRVKSISPSNKPILFFNHPNNNDTIFIMYRNGMGKFRQYQLDKNNNVKQVLFIITESYYIPPHRCDFFYFKDNEKIVINDYNITIGSLLKDKKNLFILNHNASLNKSS